MSYENVTELSTVHQRTYANEVCAALKHTGGPILTRLVKGALIKMAIWTKVRQWTGACVSIPYVYTSTTILTRSRSARVKKVLTILTLQNIISASDLKIYRKLYLIEEWTLAVVIICDTIACPSIHTWRHTALLEANIYLTSCPSVANFTGTREISISHLHLVNLIT